MPKFAMAGTGHSCVWRTVMMMLLLMPFAWTVAAVKAIPAWRAYSTLTCCRGSADDAPGDPSAAMVLFCVVGAPVGAGRRQLPTCGLNTWDGNLRPAAHAGKAQGVVMLDIYPVGVGVASIKVQDYAFLELLHWPFCVYFTGPAEYSDPDSSQC
ncbi:hypothetical protein ACVXG7_20685 [Enterobacter hormaechei]